MPKDIPMRINPVARLAFAVMLFATLDVAGIAAQASTSLPTRKLVLQVYLKSNDQYFLDTFKADSDRKESGLGKLRKITSKEKLGIILDTIDMMLFRQFCDREEIRVSDAEINSQLAQYKASLGPGATDAIVEANMHRSGVFTDARTYVKQDLLFGSYLKKTYPTEIGAISMPSAADLLKAYDDMKFNLRRPSSYRFSMLIAATQGKSDADKKKIGDAMRSIAAKLKDKPESYEEYFVKGMVDPQGSGYQTMPYAILAKTADSRSQYPSIYDRVFKLKEGEISDVIEENIGFCIVRVSQYLPEKQLGLDDFIEGLSTKAASSNPSASVMQLVANEFQSSKYNELAQKTRAEINAQTRKEGKITIYVSNLEDQLDGPELDELKALAKKGSGYSVEIK
jgi:PPIC-type PPIASE domain